MSLSPLQLGLSYCLGFVTLQAFQAVFLGSLFQQLDSFRVGAWVFGLACLGCTLLAAVFRPAELRAAMNSGSTLLALNASVALTWCCYFLAVQLVEPAIVFTIFSGMVPLGILLTERLGLVPARSVRAPREQIAHKLIIIAMVILALVTLTGHSGFVRGGWASALAGLLLSAVSGATTGIVIQLSVRWHQQGIGPLVQFGLRFLLYTLLAIIACQLGLDAKPDAIQSLPLPLIILVGLGVIALPLFLMQHAVTLLPAHRIAAVTVLGPVMVFLMQLPDGRIGYASGTLAGLAVYMSGALIGVSGGRTEQEPEGHCLHYRRNDS
ncbi:hypothetical protein ACUNV4_28005 [Granulosicoccus sp. 3-233]|uniref:hypothetical protein n=1 Tax=Granulosicoccus sp. 3-233 TaxID=3417969 RepID=UPI003D32A303